MKQIIVCGGGASGLMAAISAAGAGAKVTVLEQNEKPGRKLAATGNGRCNFSNTVYPEDAFRGGTSSGIQAVLDTWSPDRTRQFFRDIGVFESIQDGWLYPRSRSAAAFLDLLLQKAERSGVRIKTNTKVLDIRSDSDHYDVCVEGWKYEADAVILANGSSASQIRGADGSGYALAKNLGHTVISPAPALCPLKTTRNIPWSGVRAIGRVSLIIENDLFCTETGEIQFTDYGISGIPVFQLSRYAVNALKERKHVEVSLDLLPEFSEEEILQIENTIDKRQALAGLFPEKLQKLLQKEPYPLQKAKDYRISLSGFLGEEHAQVCQGGVSLGELFLPSMESRLHENLYFCGELLDVDGRCGGYNLQWAWSSGACAGIHAAKKGQ